MTGRGPRTTFDRVAFALARCLGEIGRSPRTTTGLGGIALDLTGHDLLIATGLGGSVRNPLLVEEVAVTARGHAIPLAALVTARCLGCGRLSPLTVRNQRVKAGEPDVNNGRVWRRWLSPRLPCLRSISHSGSSCCEGCCDCASVCCAGSRQGAVGSVAGASVPPSGVGVQLCRAAPGGGAGASGAATAASSVAARPPSNSAAVPGSSGRQQREERLSRPNRRRRRSSSGGTGRASKKRPRE